MKIARAEQVIDFDIEPKIVQWPRVAIKLQNTILENDKKVSLAIIVTQVQHNMPYNRNFDEAARNRWVQSIKSNLCAGTERQHLQAFGDYDNFSVVNRSQLQNILDELNFSESGFVSDDIRVKIGKQTGATHMITLDMIRYPHGVTYKDVITQRLIDIETGKVLAVGIDQTE